ncbi:hypothetical protein DFH09DRAFT_850382, partial [Mycena vulgaris]
LPASPAIFHGRETEVRHIVSSLLNGPARVSILGTGGIGKTALAKTVLHNEDVIQKYPKRLFISCDSLLTTTQLISSIGSSLGLTAQNQSANAISAHLAESDPTLLILDNLETPREQPDSKIEIEDFLATLS